MKFASAKTLVIDAQKRGYAIPALNTNGGTYDIARAALEAAQELCSPLILQVYEPNCEYRGFDHFVNLAKFLCEELKITVPVALQIDHGHSFESVLKIMKAGFTSVMFDASNYPLQENITQTAKVVEVARILGVSVEAEVGYVKGNEPKKEKLIGRIPVELEPAVAPLKTKVEEVIQFAKEVEVDMMAVSLGTTHGVYQRQPGIDFELLDKIKNAVSVPLVMHGTSGITLGDIGKLSVSGISKINFGEPFRFNYIKYFNAFTDETEHLWHPWKIMQEIKNSLKQDMSELIIAMGAEDKASSI